MPIIGIIGGTGPYAGIEQTRKIFDNTLAKKDQEHLNVICVSCPSLIPDRTDYILSGKGENPAQGMAICASMLHAAGAAYISVSCNTAHSPCIINPFLERISKQCPSLQFIDMIDCVKQAITASGFTRIGLLATIGTLTSGVYNDYFRKEFGFTILQPESRGMEKVHSAIFNTEYGIKAQSHPVTQKAIDILSAETWRLMDHGAQAIIMGCTEIPMALDGRTFGLPLYDPGLLLARKLISLVAPEKLVP